MNKKSVGLTGLFVFVVFFILEFLVNGVFLADAYKQTASVWRPDADMPRYMPVMAVGQFLFAMVFVALFARGYETEKPKIAQGMRFGLWIAFLVAPLNALLWYSVLPIPGSLAVAWFVSAFIEMVILGLIAGISYKP